LNRQAGETRAPNKGKGMSDLEWAILLVGVVLTGDVGWTEFRDWRARRLAMKRGRTLTTKFGLPPS
jgi:hypothetical protein